MFDSLLNAHDLIDKTMREGHLLKKSATLIYQVKVAANPNLISEQQHGQF